MQEQQERHDRRGYFRPSGLLEPTSLDEVAKEIASGDISRLKALRLLGGMLGGALLASIPGVAAAQDGGCPSASACCQCEYEDRDNPEEIRRKCFPLSTRSCRARRFKRLISRCEEICRNNRPRGTRYVGNATTCTSEPGFQSTCGAGAAPPRVCGFEPCESTARAAGGSEEPVRRIHRSP